MKADDGEGEDRRKTRHIDEPLGRALRAERDARDLSREWLALRLGVSTSTVQRYENGRQRVPAARLWQICALYGVAVDQVFAGLPHHVADDATSPGMAESGAAFDHEGTAPERARALARLAALLPPDRLEVAEILIRALKVPST